MLWVHKISTVKRYDGILYALLFFIEDNIVASEKKHDFRDSSKGYGDIEKFDSKNNITIPTQPDKNLEKDNSNPSEKNSQNHK
jgi:hypothetical protein